MSFTAQQVAAHNARVAAGQRKNFQGGGFQILQASPAVSTGLPAAPIQPSEFVIRPSTDEAKLNKTERAYLAHLRCLNPPHLGIQDITFKLGDDLRFTPHFNYLDANGHWVFVDVKGFQREDAFVKIKTASRNYPLLRFVIAKKAGTGWEETPIKP